MGVAREAGWEPAQQICSWTGVPHLSAAHLLQGFPTSSAVLLSSLQLFQLKCPISSEFPKKGPKAWLETVTVILLILYGPRHGTLCNLSGDELAVNFQAICYSKSVLAGFNGTKIQIYKWKSGRTAEPVLIPWQERSPNPVGYGSAHKGFSIRVICLNSGFMGPKIEQKRK